MLYEYIEKNFSNDEPIFLWELPGASKNYIRQEMKKLVDQGKLERLYSGVYYKSYKTILGTKGKVSLEKFIQKKYLMNKGVKVGYITGLQLANLYGFTTQNPSCIEVCSNEATTKQRKLEIDGRTIILYKPVTKITEENYSALQFLNLMTDIDKYSELRNLELQSKLRSFAEELQIDFAEVKKYISLYPDRVYKNIYQGGLMGELV